MSIDQAELEQAVAESLARVLPAAPVAPAILDAFTLTAAAAAAMIDHTVLKPDTVEVQIRRLCAEATEHGFASVCVNPTWVSLCAGLLADQAPKVCTVIGFPLGATSSAAKAFEARQAAREGAQEVDMVVNVGRLKDGDTLHVYNDIAGVVHAARQARARVKVILETCLLTDEEKVAGALLAKLAGADFVKTSTGFSSGGATVADVALLRATVGPELGVKASGGIRTGEDAARMAAAGATRIGASAGLRIVQDLAGYSDAAAAGAQAAGAY